MNKTTLDMDKFNRYAVIVMDIVLMFIMLLVVLVMFAGFGVPATDAEPSSVGLIFTALASVSLSAKLATLLLAILVFVLGGVLLFYEFRKDLDIQSIRLKQDDMGTVSIRQESVTNLVCYVAMQVPDVLDVDAEPVMTKQGLNIHCRVLLSPTAPIEQVKSTLESTVSEAILNHLNINVVDVGILVSVKALPGEKVQAEASA